ncbi:MAG TPA: hypothetical protein VIL36_09640 [Acidimicrobiales bacterium]
MLVRPWVDPVLDQVGFDPRSPYVERFWLGILGPSATWFVRYVADRFDRSPSEFTLDLRDCAAAIGIGGQRRPTGHLPRTLARCCEFRVARVVNRHLIEVRTRLAPLTQRQLSRLSDSLRAEHARWVADAPDASRNEVLTGRARRLALSLLELGEDAEGAERQLARWRFPAELARSAIDWALERSRTDDRTVAGAK